MITEYLDTLGGTFRDETPVAGTVTASTAPTLYVNGSPSAVTVTLDTSTTYKVVATHTMSGRSLGEVLTYVGGTVTVNGTVLPLVIEPRRIDATVSSRLAPGGNVNAFSLSDGVITAAKFGTNALVAQAVAGVTGGVRLSKSTTLAGEQLALAVSADTGTASIGRVIEDAAPALPTGTIVYDPTVGVTVDSNGRVSQWLDTTGTYAATQSDSAKRPARDGDGTEVRIVFDGARDDYLTLPNTLTTTANNYSLFAVVEQFDLTQSQFVGLGGGNGSGYAGSFGSGFGGGSATTIVYDGGPGSAMLYSTARETLVGVVSSPASRKVYVESASETIAASGSQVGQGGTLGNVFYGGNTGWAFTGAIRMLVKVDHAVTDAERQQIIDYLDWRLRVPATTSVASTKPVNVVCTGDSITYGLSSGTLYSWPSMIGHARRDATIANLGVSGRTLADIAANAATEIDPLLRDGVVNVLYAWAGTNDILYGASAATVYAAYQAFAASRFAAGWDYVIVLDVLSRVGSGAETINQFNALMAAGASTWASAYIPISRDARFSSTGNTIYFADGIHPTIAGNRVILRYALDVLDGLVASVQPSVLDPDDVAEATRAVIERDDGPLDNAVADAAQTRDWVAENANLQDRLDDIAGDALSAKTNSLTAATQATEANQKADELLEGQGEGGNGNGDITVTHTYPGSTGVVTDSDGNPADNVVIQAFVKTEYDAGTIDPRPPTTYTGSNGLWTRPLKLDPNTYTLTLYNPATKVTDVLPELEVTA